MQIPAASFAAKYKSKKEIFNFLTVQANAYLSSYETVTIYFCRDLISGKKKSKQGNFKLTAVIVLPNHAVSVAFVPQYESLSRECILDRALAWKEVWNYLPDER